MINRPRSFHPALTTDILTASTHAAQNFDASYIHTSRSSNQTRNPICRQEGRSADVHLGCFVVAKHCLPAHLDCGAEVLEDETIPGVSLEEWCEHQRLDSHELDQDVQGWP